MQVVPQRIWTPVMGEPPISLAGVRGRQEPSNNVACVAGRRFASPGDETEGERALPLEGTAAEAEEAQDPKP